MAASPKATRGGGHPLITGLSGVKTSPKWSFNGRHNALAPLNTPGPGSYLTAAPDATSKFAKSARFGFGSSTRESLDKHRVPGPGSYSHRNITGAEGPAFTCTPRRQGQGNGADKPGPGAHNLPDLCGGNGPKYSATPRRTEITRALAPGPGAYNQEDSSTMDSQPKWGFGTSTRPGIASSATTPGPGTYSHKEPLGTAPQYSMQSRREGVKPQVTPGPGTHGGHFTQFGY
eukprot:gnl/MRDRNA2_/MRDRNA2_133560_c0_seq1.p1 gnl/MRDRNA2_/MRDRNA2_133560_c0~~gnl/MRDRNA2_/MRDRNA2_133560_c0_seq1.p1  ORF type:complete len:231 (-),score=26.04 gnl/MRDRNA2_/MRDRNA2_133560_c0_seq1:117-809(-)